MMSINSSSQTHEGLLATSSPDASAVQPLSVAEMVKRGEDNVCPPLDAHVPENSVSKRPKVDELCKSFCNWYGTGLYNKREYRFMCCRDPLDMDRLKNALGIPTTMVRTRSEASVVGGYYATLETVTRRLKNGFEVDSGADIAIDEILKKYPSLKVDEATKRYIQQKRGKSKIAIGTLETLAHHSGVKVSDFNKTFKATKAAHLTKVWTYGCKIASRSKKGSRISLDEQFKRDLTVVHDLHQIHALLSTVLEEREIACASCRDLWGDSDKNRKRLAFTSWMKNSALLQKVQVSEEGFRSVFNAMNNICKVADRLDFENSINFDVIKIGVDAASRVLENATKFCNEKRLPLLELKPNFALRTRSSLRAKGDGAIICEAHCLLRKFANSSCQVLLLPEESARSNILHSCNLESMELSNLVEKSRNPRHWKIEFGQVEIPKWTQPKEKRQQQKKIKANNCVGSMADNASASSSLAAPSCSICDPVPSLSSVESMELESALPLNSNIASDNVVGLIEKLKKVDNLPFFVSGEGSELIARFSNEIEAGLESFDQRSAKRPKHQ